VQALNDIASADSKAMLRIEDFIPISRD